MIRPCAGSIDENRGGSCRAVLERDRPTAVLAVGANQSRAGLDHTAAAPEPPQIVRVEARRVDIRAARLKQGAPPLRPDARNEPLQFLAFDDSRFDPDRDLRQRVAGEVQVSPHSQESVLGEIGRRSSEEIPRSQRQLRDLGPAIAFQVEGRRPAGRVIAALSFRLEDERPALAGDLRSEARSGDSAADDDDVKFGHSPGRLRIRKPRRLVTIACSMRHLPTCCSSRSR